MQDSFLQRKLATSSQCDRSIKGNIDEPVRPLCSYLNSHNDFFTTSSCSGRIVLFQDSHPKTKVAECDPWLLISHGQVTFEQVFSALSNGLIGMVSFKFEPIVLHVEARTIEQAERLLKAAISAGFRNSGITCGSRLIVAIRCTLKLDLPISDIEGKVMISEDYFKMVIDLANQKMNQNQKLIDRLFLAIQLSIK